MVQADPRESQLDLAAKNRIAIFHEHGGPEKIELKEVDTVKESELKPGEVLVRVSRCTHAGLEAISYDCLLTRLLV